MTNLDSVTNEDLDPDFLSVADRFCAYIFEESRVKTMQGGYEVTGSRESQSLYWIAFKDMILCNPLLSEEKNKMWNNVYHPPVTYSKNNSKEFYCLLMSFFSFQEPGLCSLYTLFFKSPYTAY